MASRVTTLKRGSAVLVVAGVLVVPGAAARAEASASAPQADAFRAATALGAPSPANAFRGMQEREEVFAFKQKPSAVRQGGKSIITFASKGKCDATVAIVDGQGRIVRHLASGVLGANAPWPFQQDSLAQSIEWDGLTDMREKAPAGCKVRVSLGLQARYERDLAWLPLAGTYIEKDGRYFRTLWPPPADTPEARIADMGLKYASTRWGDKVPYRPGMSWFGPFEPAENKALPILDALYRDKAPPRPPPFAPVSAPIKDGKPDENCLADPTGFVFPGRIAMNPRLTVDREREELYVSIGNWGASVFRFDGKTGRLDQSWFPKGEFNMLSEMDFGPDGLLYVRTSNASYGHWLFRVDRTGKPVPFARAEETDIPDDWQERPAALRKIPLKGIYMGVRGFSNTHQKGFDVSPDGHFVTIVSEVYRKWAAEKGLASPEPAPGDQHDTAPGLFVRVFDRDGRELSANAIGNIYFGHGIRMDRDGNLYLAQGSTMPAGVDRLDGITDVKIAFRLMGGAGSLLKFRGQGGTYPLGRFFRDKDALPADAMTLSGASTGVTGALWAYPGLTGQADMSCTCNHTRHDMDDWARSWIPASHLYSVVVLDANGNRIARFGRYGNVDDADPACGNLHFAWLRAVAASDTALYAWDVGGRRVVKAALSYAAEETVPLP